MKNKKTILSRTAIILGFSICVTHLFNFLYIDYFSAIGARETLSSFLLGVLLLIAGITLPQNYKLGESMILGFILGSILDRLIVLLLYWEYATFDIFLLPILSSFIMMSVWYVTKDESEIHSKYLFCIIILLLLIIGLPKIMFFN